MAKQKILIFASYFLPGFKAGGPIRSIENIISHFENDYDYYIITSDRDLGDVKPYDSIVTNTWVKYENVNVCYVSRNECSLILLKHLIDNVEPGVIYFNSFFDPCFTIKTLILRRLGKLDKRINILLAPRGEFASGALVLKSWKKKVFLSVSKIFGLYRNIYWQASSEYEASDIMKWTGDDSSIIIAPNLAPKLSADSKTIIDKEIGFLRVVSVARIARNKNLLGALEILKEVKSNIVYDIYGLREDLDYWKECEEVISLMPPNIEVNYIGQKQNHEIRVALKQYHLFFMPTHGENFGHAILEAMSAGLPVLISNLTPWLDLESKGVGWDIPLDKPEKYREVLELCANMGADNFNKLSLVVDAFANEVVNDKRVVRLNKEMLNKVFIGMSDNKI